MKKDTCLYLKRGANLQYQVENWEQIPQDAQCVQLFRNFYPRSSAWYVVRNIIEVKTTLKVNVKNNAKMIKDKSRSLRREEEGVLHRITQAGHDIIGNGMCYHKECMDRIKSKI